MSKLLVVFGATGAQGGSVVRSVLADSELRAQYSVRAVTRNPSSPAAQALARLGAELAAGDPTKPDTLSACLAGVHTAFLVTVTEYGAGVYESEMAQGKALADAASAAGAKYIVFSTLPKISALSAGRYTHTEHFDVKADVEAYIRTLAVPSAFVAPGSFMANYQEHMVPQPMPDGSGRYSMAGVNTPETRIPLIDTATDTGKFVGAILADPEKFEGKVFCAATRSYTMTEVADIVSKETGKTVVYTQLPVDTFKAFLPPDRASQLVEMLLWFQDFGYYGPDSDSLIAWAVANARGTPTTFEEYLRREPLKLRSP